MKIFNTLTRRKEEFVPLEEGKVKMYVCGPTVYNLIHIGNARPMIIFDTVRRYMEYKGYEVNYVSNFTDVDDKIIKKAIEEGVSAEEISTRYIKECKKDMADMNVKPATTAPQATQEIQGMIDMIQTLIDKGYAYPAADGTVYFRVKKFKEYGKLSHKNLDDLQSGFRSLKVSGEDQKEDPLDFVLWKPKKEGEPSWPSPWCDGRPGWHIECSVMSKKYLGEEIDIHAGGEDLIFPHHENEIAQSECCNGKIFARYWMHNGFLNIDTTGSVYVFAKLFSNTAYTFLPILIAYSAAKVFGGNPYLGAVIGMIMIHPDLQNAWTVSNGVNVMQPVFGGLYAVPLVGYQGHVIPVIIAVWLMCQIEKRLHKVVPAMFDLFVTPLVSVFVTGYLTLAAIGPVFTKLENGIITGVQTLITLPYGIGSFIMGGLYAVTVVAGIHHMYTLIDLGQLARYGYTYWLPLASAANVAQGGAALAVALKSKDTKVKSMALPSALSACMGITEPAIFGVNLRYFKPFLGGLLGGACGAWYASIVGLGATGTGVTGIFGILLHLHMPLQYIIMMAISFGVSFAVTWVIWSPEEVKV